MIDNSFMDWKVHVMSIPTHQVQIGSITCQIIQAAQNRLSGEEIADFLDNFLVTAPREHIEAYLRKHQIKEISRGFSIPYIQTAEHKIVVDTGVKPTALLAGLADLDIRSEDIDIVMITHFHPDHIGGVLNENGEVTFPNARYVVGKTEWENYHAQGGRPGLEELLDTRTAIMAENLTLVEDGATIAPGMTAVALPGHTLGQTGVLVEDGDDKLLFLVDSIQTTIQASNMAWASIYDVKRDMASETRERILTQAVEEDLRTAAYHFPFPGIGKFERDGAAFKWIPEI